MKRLDGPARLGQTPRRSTGVGGVLRMVGGRLRGRASARGDNMRRVRGNVRLSLGAAVLLGSAMLGILAFSGPAAAAAVLMVSPSTGLTNGQSVNVTASGFTASSPGAVLECNNDRQPRSAHHHRRSATPFRSRAPTP